MKRLLLAATLLLLTTVVARADWNPGDPYKMHYPQLPDLTKTGVDVGLTNAVLADDWKCTWSGYVTDVHIWTSFYHNQVPAGGPGSLPVTLGIYSDVPAGPTTYSHPGQLLWQYTFNPGMYKSRLYANTDGEWWYDPVTGMVEFPGDTLCFQDNFFIPATQAFYQKQGTIYWLSVRSDLMGWKSSLDHFNDDAVFAPPGATWMELHYPSQHPYAGQSMDLSFVITPEPSALVAIGMGITGLFGLTARRRR
jgi:hypothetical protein